MPPPCTAELPMPAVSFQAKSVVCVNKKMVPLSPEEMDRRWCNNDWKKDDVRRFLLPTSPAVVTSQLDAVNRYC
ncbi:hypothetical protein BRADI_3g44116v3 [Brachypodium distachyon]|uniref:Uncharacterized protein n=1 Tax=Brachypodium distachyon TaxID=15368 RepID=A0A0Q3FN33_BRADI|nr:hypothetical protein BRADI_3g44116v3 [Brachypodium distachyon]